MKNMFLLFVLFCSMTMLFGQTPSALTLQGVLREATGAAVADGDYSMTFKMYDAATGGAALWTETQTVAISKGQYNVRLGAVTALDLPFDKQYFVGVTVGGAELAPRTELASLPYTRGLVGSKNIFPGSGPVGIGTKSITPGFILQVKGYPKFENEVDLYAGSANENAARFFGPVLFKDKATLETDKNFNIFGRLNIYNTNNWSAGGIQFENQASIADNPEQGLRIKRYANLMEFVTPDNTSNGGFEFIQKSATLSDASLMTIDNDGTVTVPNQLEATEINMTNTQSSEVPVMSKSSRTTKIMAGYWKNNALARATENFSITREAAGTYTVWFGSDFQWEGVISAQCLSVTSSGATGNRFIVKRQYGANTFQILQKNYNNNSLVDGDFFLKVICIDGYDPNQVP